MAAGSAVCQYRGYDHRPSLPLQLLSRSPPVCLGSLLSGWTLRGEPNKHLPSSYPPPSWGNQQRAANNETHSSSSKPEMAVPLPRSSPRMAFNLLTLKRSLPDFGTGARCARIEVVAASSFGSGTISRSPFQVPPCRKIICGQAVQTAERGAGVSDEYAGGDYEYDDPECGGEDDGEGDGEDQWEKECSGDEFNDSGCQYVIEEDGDCDDTAIQFFVDALSEDECDGDEEEEGIVAFEDLKNFETSRTPFMSLLSVESGYAENLSDSACTPDTGTTEDESDGDFDDESDCECAGSADADTLWKSFEEQTFFVVDCGKAKTACKSPQVVNPPICESLKCNDESSSSDGRLNTKGLDCLDEDRVEQPPCCGSARRHVTFKPDSELVVVHHMVTWNFAYRSCRKGPWEQYVIDRDHFRRKVEEFGKIFEPCYAKRKQQLQSLL